MRITLIFTPIFLLAWSAFAEGVKLRVNGGLRVGESRTTTTTRQTIIGPNGTRTVNTDESSETTELPTTTTTESQSDTQVTGVSDPGIRIEKKVFLPVLPPKNGPIPPGGYYYSPVTVEPEVKGGPGSISTRSTTKTTTLPKISVEGRE